jgi:hypothetical protein
MLPILNLILPILAPILNKLIPDPAQQAQVQQELTKALLENEATIMDAMKSVMVADSQSESWLVKNARPSVVFWCLGCMTWIVAIAPVFGLVDQTLGALRAVPDNLWNVMLVGIGAYTFSRGIEKGIANGVAGLRKKP